MLDRHILRVIVCSVHDVRWILISTKVAVDKNQSTTKKHGASYKDLSPPYADSHSKHTEVGLGTSKEQEQIGESQRCHATQVLAFRSNGGQAKLKQTGGSTRRIGCNRDRMVIRLNSREQERRPDLYRLSQAMGVLKVAKVIGNNGSTAEHKESPGRWCGSARGKTNNPVFGTTRPGKLY